MWCLSVNTSEQTLMCCPDEFAKCPLPKVGQKNNTNDQA